MEGGNEPELKNSEEVTKKRPQLFETFTKLWVSILMVVAIIDLQLSYVLAYIGRDQIAESLSVAVVTEIIGVIGIYIIRAFFDTVSEKKHEVTLKQMEYDNTPDVEDEDLPEPDEESEEVDDNDEAEG